MAELPRVCTGLAIALAALVIVFLCAAAAAFALKSKHTNTNADMSIVDIRTRVSQQPPQQPPQLRNWAVVGAGLAAASFLNALPRNVRGDVVVYEADARVGGRALSVPQPAVAVSTQSAPREFAAWIFEPLQHSYTTALLRDVGMPTLSVQLRTSATILWTPERGAQAFDALRVPAHVPETMTFAELVAASKQSKDVWFAHTGLWVDDCPRAAADIVARLDLPIFAFTPSGFGWQDVTLRALGATPIVYNRVLERVDVGAETGAGVGANAGADRVKLTFASGDAVAVAGAVLTLPPPAMARLQGMPAAFRAALSDAFVQVPVGVLYATWAAADVWWRGNSVGFGSGSGSGIGSGSGSGSGIESGSGSGCIATTLPLGRLFIVSTNDVRCSMSGVRDVGFWTDMMLAPDPDAIRKEVAAQIARVIGADRVALPVAVAFRAWPQAVSLWNASPSRARTRAALTWPFGRRAPVVWASSDVSDVPGWVEGAVQAGAAAARYV